VPWWRQFGSADLRLVRVRFGGELVAVLPFYGYHEPCSGCWKLLLVGAGTSDYLDGCFAPECGVLDVVAALEGLRDEGGFDVLDAVQVRAASLLAAALRQMGAVAGNGEPTSRVAAMLMAELPVKIRRNQCSTGIGRSRTVRCDWCSRMRRLAWSSLKCWSGCMGSAGRSVGSRVCWTIRRFCDRIMRRCRCWRLRDCCGFAACGAGPMCWA